MQMDKQRKELEALQVEKPDSILTMYLNTDPSDPEQSGGEWKIQLKNSMNSFENYLKQSNDKKELEKFKSVRKQVEGFMFENQKNLKKSVIIFASSNQSMWFAEILQLRVETTFYWQQTPVLDQLNSLYQKYPKLGIVLTQQKQVKIIEAELGKVVNTKLFELDLDTEDWRQFAGPRANTGGKNLQTDQFDKRVEANQKRWFKNLAPTLDKVAKHNNWKRVYLAGEKQEALDLAGYMQKEIDNILYQNILEHEESSVLEKVLT